MNISVVITSFNSEKTIERCINSVINQSIKVFEIIIIDDCSTDSTIELIRTKFIDIYLIINEKNTGNPSFGRNLGISLACGDFIALLDSDDEWHPNKIELQSRHMLLKNFAITCTAYDVFKGNKFIRHINPPDFITFDNLLLRNSIGYSTVMFHKSIKDLFYFNKIGHEDYDLWLRILNNEIIIHSISTALTKYYKINGSLSSNKLKVLSFYWNIYKKYSSNRFVTLLLLLKMLFARLNLIK